MWICRTIGSLSLTSITVLNQFPDSFAARRRSAIRFRSSGPDTVVSFRPDFSSSSYMFSAITTFKSMSISCVVRNRLRSRFRGVQHVDNHVGHGVENVPAHVKFFGRVFGDRIGCQAGRTG